MADDRRLPDLPSDEELGIAGMELDDEGEVAERPSRRSPAATEGREAPPPDAPSPPGEPGPSHPWRGPLTLLLLLVLAWLGSSYRTLPDAAPLDAPGDAFSAGRAMLDVVAMSRGAHPPGSPEHARVRGMLLERLAELGLEPGVRTSTQVERLDGTVRAVAVSNVLARVPGTASTGALLLTAHYDARGLARGAGDDATGTAVILETLRALRGELPLENDLIVLLTDAEELGLVGAESFVAEHPWMDDVSVVLSVEMRGGGGPSIMFETGSENGWIVERLAEAGVDPQANSLALEVYRRMPNDTDFSPFRDRGVQGLNFAAIGRPSVYHQAYDDPVHLDVRTVQHHGESVLGLTRALGSADLADVDAPDRVYLRAPFLGIVTWPVAVSYGLAMALLLGVVAVGGLTLRRGSVQGAGAGFAGAVAGLVLGLAVVAGTAGGAYLLFALVRGFHPEAGSLHGSAFHAEGWYVATLSVLAATLATALLGLARRRWGLGALSFGAALLPAAGALALTFAAPLGAATFQLASLLALVGAAVGLGVLPRRRPGLVRWAAFVAIAAGVLALWTPLVELLWLAMSLRAAPLVGGVLGLGALLLLPALDALREPGGAWAPALGVVAAAGLLGVGVLHAEPTAERPAPSTLIYALDRESGEALWATRPGAGATWAADRTGEAFEETSTRERWGLGAREYLVAPAPAVDAPAPRLAPEGPGAGVGGVGAAAAVGSPPGAAGAEAPPAAELDSLPRADPSAVAGSRPGPDSSGVAGAPTAAGPERSGDRPDDSLSTRGGEPSGHRPGDSVSTPGAVATREPAGAGGETPGPRGPEGEGRRTLALDLRSALEAETVVVELPSSGDVFLRRVAGRPVGEVDPGSRSGSARVERIVFAGTRPEGMDLELDVGAAVDTVRLVVIEHLQRPGELVGERRFVRPPWLSPDIVAGSDRALVRTVWLVDASSGRVSRPAPPGPEPDPGG